jgi:hypothetical protein
MLGFLGPKVGRLWDKITMFGNWVTIKGCVAPFEAKETTVASTPTGWGCIYHFEATHVNTTRVRYLAKHGYLGRSNGTRLGFLFQKTNIAQV